MNPVSLPWLNVIP